VCQGLVSFHRHIGTRKDPGDEVVENYETANLRQGDEEVNKRIKQKVYI